jgi:hypothetical protein
MSPAKISADCLLARPEVLALIESQEEWMLDQETLDWMREVSQAVERSVKEWTSQAIPPNPPA